MGPGDGCGVVDKSDSLTLLPGHTSILSLSFSNYQTEVCCPEVGKCSVDVCGHHGGLKAVHGFGLLTLGQRARDGRMGERGEETGLALALGVVMVWSCWVPSLHPTLVISSLSLLCALAGVTPPVSMKQQGHEFMAL